MIVLYNPADPKEAYGPYFEVPVEELRKLGFEKDSELWVKKNRHKEIRLRSIKLKSPEELRLIVKNNVLNVRRVCTESGPNDAA